MSAPSGEFHPQVAAAHMSGTESDVSFALLGLREGSLLGSLLSQDQQPEWGGEQSGSFAWRAVL